jgi:tight adherence protein B
MDRQLVTVGLLVAGAVFAAGLGLFVMYLDRRRQRVRRRLDELDRMSTPELAATGASILRDETLSSVPTLDRFLRRFSIAYRARALLTQADVSMHVGTFFGLSAGLALLGGLIAAAWSGMAWAGLIGAALVGSIPTMVVYRKKEKRKRMFERQFPDALDLMTGALRSGMAFTAALQVVSEESPDPVAGEFRVVFEEHRLGLSLRESLQEMTKRVDSTELRLFVTAVLIQKDTGGNLAEILDGTAYVIRDRFRILGDVRTITAQARLSGLILTLLPLAMAGFLIIVVPDYLKTLITDPVGPYFIGAAVIMQIIGYLAIRKIVNIKV